MAPGVDPVFPSRFGPGLHILQRDCMGDSCLSLRPNIVCSLV